MTLSTKSPWFFGIGIDHYQRFHPLRNAVKDVKDIVSVLTERYGFSDERTILLLNEDAIRHNIIAEFEELVEKIGKDDSVVIYFSGHGHYNTRTELGYWIPADAQINGFSSYVPNSTVTDYLRALKSKHTLLISDACFSGSLFVRGVTRSAEAAMDLAAIDSRWAICSGRHDEQVLDGQPGTNSPFAESILDALRENTGPYLRVASLANRVVDQTRANYQQLPEGSPLNGVGHKGGEFVFRLSAPFIGFEEQLWRESREIGTAEAYREYVSQYPDGKYRQQALKEMTKLRHSERAQSGRDALSTQVADATHDHRPGVPDEPETRVLGPGAKRQSKSPKPAVVMFAALLALSTYIGSTSGVFYMMDNSSFMPLLAVWVAIKHSAHLSRFLLWTFAFSALSLEWAVTERTDISFGYPGLFFVSALLMIALASRFEWQTLRSDALRSFWPAAALLSLAAILLPSHRKFDLGEAQGSLIVDFGTLVAAIAVAATVNWRRLAGLSSRTFLAKSLPFAGPILVLAAGIGSTMLLSFDMTDNFHITAGLYTREMASVFCFGIAATRLIDWRLVITVIVFVSFGHQLYPVLLDSAWAAEIPTDLGNNIEEIVVTVGNIGPDMPSISTHTIAAVLLGAAVAPFIESHNPASLNSARTVLFAVPIIILECLPSSSMSFTIFGGLGTAFVLALALPHRLSLLAPLAILMMHIATSYYVWEGDIDDGDLYEYLIVGLQLLVFFIVGRRYRISCLKNASPG